VNGSFQLKVTDAKGRSLLWHAAFNNDVAAASAILKMPGGSTLITAPRDAWHKKTPWELAGMQPDPTLRRIFMSHIDIRHIDRSNVWTEKEKENFLRERASIAESTSRDTSASRMDHFM